MIEFEYVHKYISRNFIKALQKITNDKVGIDIT